MLKQDWKVIEAVDRQKITAVYPLKTSGNVLAGRTSGTVTIMAMPPVPLALVDPDGGRTRTASK